jgi:nitroreductase
VDGTAAMEYSNGLHPGMAAPKLPASSFRPRVPMPQNAINHLLTRRSVSVKELTTPAPNAEELALILRAATRVPDHGKLAPWRITILRGAGALELGAIAAGQFLRQYPDATEAQLAHERTRFTRAPLVLAVLSTPVLGTKPVWEQELSAGAVCMNILHATHMFGYGGKWLTEWVAYDPAILHALGGGADDRIAGFLYLGSKTLTPDDRERPKLEEVVREWKSPS